MIDESVEIEARRAGVAREQDVRALTSGQGARVSTLLRDVRLMLIALWLGAAVFFGGAVAPSVFSVLRARHVTSANELAGTIVTRTLAIVNTSGFFISLFLLASAFLFRARVRARAFYAEVLSLALIALMTGVGQWIINARLLALRLAMGRPIDEVDLNDPLRVAFNSLHGYSVIALGIGILAAATALLLIARRRGRRSEGGY
jgi:hypothetical protein